MDIFKKKTIVQLKKIRFNLQQKLRHLFSGHPAYPYRKIRTQALKKTGKKIRVL